MFPLWKEQPLHQVNIQDRPSPKNKIKSHAQDFAPFLVEIKISSIVMWYQTIKETLLFIFLRKRTKAGMTVEASFLLPLFLFFFLNLSCCIELMRLHGNIQSALREVGNKISLYASVLEKENISEDKSWKEKEVLGYFTGSILGQTYIKRQIAEYLGEEYLKQSPMKNGADSLVFWKSNFSVNSDTFEIVVMYEVSPWSNLIPFRSFYMKNTYYGHFWNGYTILQNTQDNGQMETVYITKDTSVYHTRRTCSHLQLSIEKIPLQQVPERRNENGKKYVICEKCKKFKDFQFVYITREGTCYHSYKECSGLKRTIYSVKKWEVKNYRICQRCAKEE